MSTINGIGLRYLGHGPIDEKDQSCWTTEWFTFLFLPVFPISRRRIRFLPPDESGQSYYLLNKSPLMFNEIARTYLWGWIIIPFSIFGPLLMGIALVPTGFEKEYPNLSVSGLICGFVWLFFMIWSFGRWDNERGLPSRKAWLAKFIK